MQKKNWKVGTLTKYNNPHYDIGVIHTLRSFFLQSSSHGLNLFILLFILATLPLILITSQKPQQLQEKAAGPTCQLLPLTIPVVVEGYFPPDPANLNYLDPIESGWPAQRVQSIIGKNLTIPQWHSVVTQMANNQLPWLSDATKFHGYKDPTAPPFLQFKIIDTKFFDKKQPHSTFIMPGTTQQVRPDYNKTMQDINVCNYVDNLGVKEIWVYSSGDINSISVDESRMSSAYGDVSNSYPHDPGFPAQFRLPRCQHAYTMYNFEMWPDPNFINNTVHNRMHQIENMIGFTAENSTFQITWPPTPWSTTNMFWHDFTTYLSNILYTNRISCGTTHNPPNAPTAYDYTNTSNIVSSNCETWNPDPTKTTFKTFSCQEWGCSDIGYYKWWMQNLPGYNNGITYQGQQMRNWWEAMYDFEGFVTHTRSLFGTSILSCIIPPTHCGANGAGLCAQNTCAGSYGIPAGTIGTGNCSQVLGSTGICCYKGSNFGTCAGLPASQSVCTDATPCPASYPFKQPSQACSQNCCITVPSTTPPISPTHIPTTMTPTPTPTSTITPTGTIVPPSPTITSSSPTISISPTSGTSGSVTFTITLCPHGLGNCGDNANPQGGNPTPQHPQRTATLTILNQTNQPVATTQGNVNFSATAHNFQGTSTVSNLSPGSYLASIKLDGFLAKQFSGIITITPNALGPSIQLPPVALVTGDINNDNQLDILDYNLLISCFGSKQTSSSCTTATASDINDDGTVDGQDYNLFLRELSVQIGS